MGFAGPVRGVPSPLTRPFSLIPARYGAGLSERLRRDGSSSQACVAVIARRPGGGRRDNRAVEVAGCQRSPASDASRAPAVTGARKSGVGDRT